MAPVAPRGRCRLQLVVTTGSSSNTTTGSTTTSSIELVCARMRQSQAAAHTKPHNATFVAVYLSLASSVFSCLYVYKL